jgi:hypothetical protein
MADIVESDVKIYKSEDQTDTATGGGRMSSDVVVSGEVNNLFPNISRIDRLQGRIQPRKVFQKIDSANTAVYSGGHLVIRDMPLDENVSVLMFPTEDHNDHLPDIVDKIEDYYQATVPAGNAGLEYAVSPGDQQLVFKIRHYEYTPVYNAHGRLIYNKKIDTKYALNITVGELAILDDGAGTQEHIHIQAMERVTETLDNADQKHYYIVEYVIVTLSAGLLNGFPSGIVPYRTKKNPAWACFGAMLLGQDASVGDTVLRLSSTRARLAPVVERDIRVSDQAFFGPPEMVNDVAVGADGVEWSIPQAEQINVSEAVIAVSGKTSYTYVLQNKPLKESTLEIWYRSNLGWFVITETTGTLSGDGTGSVSDDGVVTFTLDQAADPDTHIMFFYTREHSLAESDGVDLTSPDVGTSEDQYALSADAATASGSLSGAPVQAGLVTVYVDQGSGWEEIGSDGGAGVITGANIETCEIDYYSGDWSLELKDPYTVGVVLRFTYVPMDLEQVGESGGFGSEFDGRKDGTVSFSLSRIPIQDSAGTVEITLSMLDFGGIENEGGLQTMRIVLVDDGSGNFSVATAPGSCTASGSINYRTGLCVISFHFDDDIDGGLSWQASYYVYVDAVFPQETLPYKFNIGTTEALPGSLLVKYFTESGGDTPWYAREMGKVLNLQASMEGWAVGSVFSVSDTDQDPKAAVYVNGQWIMTAHPISDFAVVVGTEFFLSINGSEWASIDHDIPNTTRITYLAVKESGPAYVGVGHGHSSGDNNVGASTDLAAWTTAIIDNGAQCKGVVYVVSLDLFIAITATKIFTSSDDGITWTEQTSQIAADMSIITVVDFGSGPVVMIFGKDNKVQTSTDGTNWILRQSGLVNQTVDSAVITIDDQNTLFTVDSGANVVKTTDGENFESLASLNGAPVSLASDGVFNVVAALDDGSIDISNDHGKTWNNLTVDHLLPGATGYQIAFGGGAWLHLSFDSDDTQPATLTQNIMTDGAGDPIKTVGTFNPDTGTGEINAGDLPVSAQARYFLFPRRVSDFVVFTWGAGPVHENSFTAFGRTHTGALLILEEDPGNPETLTGDGTGAINKETGVAELSFAFPIRPESLRLSYSYGTIYKPEYEAINTRALPLDGLVPVVQQGDVAVLVEHARARLTAAIDTDDMAIDVDDGSVFPAREVRVRIDDEEITGTMSGNTFSVVSRAANGTTAASHTKNTVMELVTRREEMLPVLQVAGNSVSTPNPLAYGYKAGGAILTTAIVRGDLQAQETGHHTQVSWDGATWQDDDEYTGDPAGGTYNFTNYPLGLTNQGATTERWLLEVVSLSPVLVDIRGEYLGVIATDQDTSAEIAPTNPNTDAPYFTLDAAGWGAGWQVGNILRFNTVMAGGPAWITRVINARASDIQDDYATLQSRGDVAV